MSNVQHLRQSLTRLKLGALLFLAHTSVTSQPLNRKLTIKYRHPAPTAFHSKPMREYLKLFDTNNAAKILNIKKKNHTL